MGMGLGMGMGQLLSRANPKIFHNFIPLGGIFCGQIKKKKEKEQPKNNAANEHQ